MTILDAFELSLCPREIIGLYQFMKRQEDHIPEEIASVLEKLRERLYSRLSIDEMENLDIYLGVLVAADPEHR